MITDPIANYLTSFRNALKAKHARVHIPHSKEKEHMTQILEGSGYIKGYQVQKSENYPQPTLAIQLKYDLRTKAPAIRELTRVSRPGMRHYSKVSDLPHVKRGLGIAIVSTSQGIVTDKQARKQNMGGEVLCHIY